MRDFNKGGKELETVCGREVWGMELQEALMFVMQWSGVSGGVEQHALPGQGVAASPAQLSREGGAIKRHTV